MKIIQPICLIVMLSLPVSAATLYVRAGASGAATGADWTDAFTTLPAALTRGNTYYVADGSYVEYTFDDAEIGTDVITVKKATVDDHGTETGWDNSYGDGVADWPGWVIENSYYTLDGQVGQWASDWPGYAIHGFKVTRTMTAPSQKAVNIGANGARVGSITISHVEVTFGNSGTDWEKGGDGVYFYGTTNLLFQYLWVHNIGRDCIYYITGTNVTIEYSFLEENGQAQLDEVFDPVEHAQVLNWGGGAQGRDSTYRYNVLRRFRSTGGLMLLPSMIDSEIYGSIFLQDQDDSLTGSRVMSGFSGSDGTVTNVAIYNNTFANITKGGAISAGNGYTNCEIRNNIFLNVKNAGAIGFFPAIIRSHNWYYDVGADMSSETSVQIGTGDPFVNAAADNYRLTAQTDAGFTPTLSATDMDGVAITWPTRGAFEHTDQVVPYPTSAIINGNVRVRGRVTIGP